MASETLMIPVYFLYIIVIVNLATITIMTKAYKGRKSWGNFPNVILSTIVVTALITAFLVTMPDVVTNFVTKLGEIWTNF